MGCLRATLCLAFVLAASGLRVEPAAAQGNFEIQVYGSETTASGTTMFELHSNAAIRGTTPENAGPIRSTHSPSLADYVAGMKPTGGTGRVLELATLSPALIVDRRAPLSRAAQPGSSSRENSPPRR
jgi:hypothetical protein